MPEIEPQKEENEVPVETQEEPAEKSFDYPKIEVPETENFVFADEGTLLENNTFTTGDERQENVPDVFMRPLVIGEPGKEIFYEQSESAINVKSTYAMGKAAFIEYPTTIDGQDYNYIQWKGVCKNKVCETLPEREGQD